MRLIQLYIFLVLSSVVIAQTSLRLDVCDSLPANFYQLDLETLYVANGQGYCDSHGKILDKRIAKLKNLKELTYNNDIYQNEKRDAKLPKAVCKLRKLEKLSTNVPIPEIFKLSQLESLELNLAGYMKLVDNNSFGKFKNLEQLKISCDRDAKNHNFSGIADLENLKTVYLDLPSQQLIDEVLSNPNLVNVHVNRGHGLTFDFSKCPNIKNLDLSTGDLQILPPSIYNLTQLETLVMTYNKISVIDPRISNLKNLKNFSFYHNELVSLPEELTQCSQLEYIYLDYNRSLGNLPQSIGALEHLKDLTANQCNLQSIPPSLSLCYDLRMLQLAHNKLVRLAVDFSGLKKIVNLQLNDNKLSDLPRSVFQLPMLDQLNLSNNQLTSLPNSIFGMTNLTRLSIYSNQINYLPEDIGELPNLEQISAYANQLKSLPSSLGKLKKLSSLYVGDNQLTELPESFVGLEGLMALEIQKNPLTKFPTWIYDLPKLDRVWISYNTTMLPGYKETTENPIQLIQDIPQKQEENSGYKFLH